MRKERNERAKLTATIKKDQSSSQLPVGLNNIGNLVDSMSATEADIGTIELISPVGGGGGGGSQGKSKNKKKKKGKR